jgi:ABC-type Fe2+-enterobactin transport system substrate-binding protein
MPAPRKEPMTAYEAAAFVNRMKKETSKQSRVRLMQLGLRIGNLSEGAKVVYRDALKEDGARP